jgi:DNA-binding NarL/FixJ family response regulator
VADGVRSWPEKGEVEAAPSILVVEDEPGVARALERRHPRAHHLPRATTHAAAPAQLRAIERLLRGAHDVRVASTLAAARELLARPEPFTGAVLDVGLPDGSGLDFLAELRAARPGVRVLVLTVHHEPENVNRAQRLGAEYAVKPDFTEGLLAFAGRLAGAAPSETERALRAVDEIATQHALSPRERDILRLAVAERSRPEIAADLALSVNTVKFFTRLLLAKCGESSLTGLARRLRAGTRTTR